MVFLILPLILASPAQAEKRICPNVVLESGKLTLDANERVLICGSQKSDQAWKKVPPLQAQYTLTTMLNSRGYLKPEFRISGADLFVKLGPVTKIKKFNIAGGRKYLDAGKKRKVRGAALTSAKLDEITDWGELELRRQGFACPVVEVQAQVWDGVVDLTAKIDEPQRIGRIERTGYGDLKVESLKRFEAFESGDIYDVVDTQLTSSRLLSQGIFQDAYITAVCHEKTVDLKIVANPGKPRLFRFGFGGSTEELPFADVWFKDTLIDRRASNYTAALHASPIRQSLTLTSEFYAVPFSDLFYVGPRAKAERRDESAYEVETLQTGVDIGRLWDMYHVRLDGKFGPTWNYEKTIRGDGPADLDYLSLDGSLTFQSHDYEAFTRNQYEGWTGTFRYSGQREGVGAGLNLDRYDLDFKYLWNISSYSPPLFIFATRIGATAIETDGLDLATRAELPTTYRVYYGGGDNLRGFSRGALDNGGIGFLTALYAGFELRLIEELPYHIEPFALYDVARLGTGSFHLDDPVYSSIGAGLRWASPFGTIRGQYSRGSITNGDATTAGYKQDWVFYFSFGQEF